MRWFLVCLGLASTLGAQAALHILAVERRGPPPYEAADRVYRLDGGQEQGLRVGSRLLVKRGGETRAFGHLWVTEVQKEQAVARFEPMAALAPMKGDLAFLEVMVWPPEGGGLETDPLARIPAPMARPEAPPQEGILFFLPQRSELSLAGLKKLESWVEQWGAEGRWAIQVPAAKTLKPALQNQRAEALQAALRALGVQLVKLETSPRTVESKYDPAWIRHWD
jgi:hypothetical protein